MTENVVTIDVTKRQAIFGSKDQEVLQVESDPELGNLKLRRSLTLGPKENQIVAVTCEKEFSGQVLVEAISRTADFRIIDSVCSMCKGEVWIPIVNISLVNRERDFLIAEYWHS